MKILGTMQNLANLSHACLVRPWMPDYQYKWVRYDLHLVSHCKIKNIDEETKTSGLRNRAFLMNAVYLYIWTMNNHRHKGHRGDAEHTQTLTTFRQTKYRHVDWCQTTKPGLEYFCYSVFRFQVLFTFHK